MPTRPAFAVHSDDALARAEDDPNGVGLPFQPGDRVTVSWRAERYVRRNGDTDGPLAPLTITAKADGAPETTYEVAHGLVGAPAVWRVSRVDTGEAVKATLVGADKLRVKFGSADVSVNQTVELWLWARVG